MRRANRLKGSILSRIELKATLSSGLAEVKEALSCYPGLVLKTSKSKLRYEIGGEELADRHYVIEFTDNALVIELYSSVSPLYFINEMLVRLISISSILKDHYTIKFDELVPYLIEALSTQQLGNYLKNFEFRQHVHNGDIILARRIIELTKEKALLSKDYKIKSAKALVFLQKLIVSAYNYNASISLIKATSGAEDVEIKDALKRLPEVGYKIVYSSKDKFNVVPYEG
jgi:hypothetical protein